ncbi:uncharacterized protein LOC129724977 [Wyeomyia smithii]|uniref:uncharacterized protein LOC129724977 n=1 Tax=Wyeomyia smithii TaxID=174621 RepID=UPI002467C6FF|nr:uncharacterized protein LOC129724977 [Wyeomyia smithii]
MVTVPDGYNSSERRVVGTSVMALIGSVIALIFDLQLIFGMFMRRENLIHNHIRFIGGACTLLVIVLFISCIATGIIIGSDVRGPNGEIISALIISSTLLHITGITIITVVFSFIMWVLQGVIACVKQDKINMVTNMNENLI